MWWSSSRSEALYAGISSEMSAAPLVPSQPVGVFGGSVKGAQAQGMGLRRREKRRCGWGWGGRVSLSARHVRAVLRQTGCLAFLAFYLPDCPLVLLCCLLHVTCCLITVSMAVTTRASAFPESWRKRSHALLQRSELIPKARGSRVTCRPMVSSHSIRLGSLLRTEFLMASGGDCQCPRFSGVCYPTAVPGPPLVLVTTSQAGSKSNCSMAGMP